ncbi:MAG: AAA family ATPase [Betaproteobacteria bacterium]|nr:AAA family ATPase [Betaproteobacteria bacterium]
MTRTDEPPSSAPPGPPALPAESLYRAATLAGLDFETTDDLPDLPSLIGQARARDALSLAVEIRARGYNVFMLGPAGVGKRSLVEEFLRERARNDRPPDDWCYVNNFDAPNRPRALRLAPGEGTRLRDGMRQFVDELRASIPALLESEEFRSRAEQIDADFTNQQEQLFVALGAEASRENIALIHTPAGFSFAPMRDEQVISPEQYEALPEAEREKIQGHLGELQDKLQKTVRQAQQIQKQKRNAIKDLTREMTLSVVGALTEELKAKFAGAPEVLRYLDAVQADVLGNSEQFRRTPDADGNPLMVAFDETTAFRRYEVNVLVGGEPGATGAPVVTEDYPTFPNLIGRIENMARLGTLVTDFALIQAGSLHRANGGYLVIDAYKLLGQPFAWDALKRALSSGQLRPETMGQSIGLVTTVALDPEPIPLDVKVVLVGERLIYHLLLAYDPEFEELFKVSADFEDRVERSPEHEALYARLVATLVRQAGLCPFDRGAVARVIEQAARSADDSERLSTQLEELSDLLREAELLARREHGGRVTATHVQGALDARDRRSDRVRRRVLEAIVRGEILIDTSGAVIGQINGLSVSMVGRSSFGHPTRITATTRLGDGEVVDIHREVQLGGPIHSKGVITLAAFLASRYSSDRPQSLAATLAFEQTYGEVEGDSASLAELLVLISSLAGAPLAQSLAVTGSVNQHGIVQPIGGVNEKIEGFFDVCAARGLDGSHGVVIPATNVAHLMLRADVVDAVRDGRFRLHAVTHVDEALEIFTGMVAGRADDAGNFPEGSVNFAVGARLVELSVMRQAFANMQVKVRRVRDAAPASPEAPKPPKPPKPKPPKPPKPGD